MNSKVLEVIYHDTHLIAINKPHGLLVHAASLTFNHPHLGESVHLKAQYQPPFLRIAAEMGFSLEG